MELRQLRYFVAVAEELHFGRAAERLHIAQPALSQQIQTLERILGVQLLQRTKRQVALTDAGRLFLQQARLTLLHAEQTVQVAVQASRGAIGRLVLGFTGMTLYSVMPTIVRVFRERYPGIDLVVQEMCTEDQARALQNSQIHVGLLNPPIRADAIDVEPIFSEPLIAVLPDQHPLAGLPVISLAYLADEPFILFPRTNGPCLYDAIMSMCCQAEFSPRVVYETPLPQTKIGLVAAGIGVTLICASMANVQRPGVVYKTLLEQTPELKTAVAWRRADNISPVVQSFLEVARGADITLKSVAFAIGVGKI
ncbi:MAG: LysR family transcriptional regulator [Chloroflexales bacterium]|nr:LysR family transcriptional regulator [Chloroflexales bacterium]